MRHKTWSPYVAQTSFELLTSSDVSVLCLCRKFLELQIGAVEPKLNRILLGRSFQMSRYVFDGL